MISFPAALISLSTETRENTKQYQRPNKVTTSQIVYRDAPLLQKTKTEDKSTALDDGDGVSEDRSSRY